MLKAITDMPSQPTDDTSEQLLIECLHYDQPHEAFGLCRSCYRKLKYHEAHPNAVFIGSVKDKTAVCHSDRPMFHSGGLCKSCYQKQVKYGVDFIAMYIVQAGLCKCCGDWYEEGQLVVDHSHKTDRVRGLVCYSCNFGIGIAEYEPSLTVLDYLDNG